MGVVFPCSPVAALSKGHFLRECQLIIIDAFIHRSSLLPVRVNMVFVFSAFKLHFAHSLFISRARIAKTSKYVRASVAARKERVYPSI